MYSEYLPYSSHILQDNTLDEDDDYTHVEDNDSTLTENENNTPTENDDSDTYPEDYGSENQPIEVVVGNQDEGWNKGRNPPQNWIVRTNNITIKRNSNCLLASQLPTIFVTNHRSFFPKFQNFVDIIKTLNLTLGLHSEVWEDRENKTHSQKIEEALELQGIQYISSPRPNQRGGGAAISLISGEFTLTKLDVIIPKNLEVVLGLVRPKQPTTDFK